MFETSGRWTARVGAALLAAVAVPTFSAGVATPSEAFGPRVSAQQTTAFASLVVNPPRRSNSTADSIRYWNQVAIDASGLDHTPVEPGPVEPGSRVFGEQLGPVRSVRAIAIVQIAVFDAVNALTGNTYRSHTGLARETRPASVDAAIARAALDTLVQMFPSQARQFNSLYNAEIARITDNQDRKNLGIAIGQRSATRILGMRTNDGSQFAEPRLGVDWFTSNNPGRWRQDPISQVPIALGARWSRVRPFAIQSASQFRTPPFPALNSAAYTTAFNEVKRLGGDGEVTPTERSADQTIAGIYWAYDGTPSLCAPPRLYNQIATTVSLNETRPIELARLYGLLNVAMMDAGLSSWESKYFWDIWRPVTGVREADSGTGPSRLGDGNPATIGDASFSPLGAPASNLNGPNFTPPFPAYPSGHATFGGALFQTLRNYFGTDNRPFTFVSDEFNGITRDNEGNVRPLVSRSFNSFTQAEEENGQSRIYLGIHWSFDKTAGIAQGRAVANYVFANRFQRN